MQFFRKGSDEKKRLGGDLRYYWSQIAYIKSSQRHNNMRAYLLQAQRHLENDKLTDGFDALYRAKREFILARTKGQIYYYRSTSGMLLAAILVIVFSLGLLAFWLFQDIIIGVISSTLQIPKLNSIALAPFLAAFGGGIGGCAAVLIQAIDVDPESEVVSKSLWYAIKPVLGAALGVITYFAVVSGLSIVTNEANVDNYAGAVIIGFLAGFFESFSTGVLARIAGQFAEASKEQKESEKDDSELEDQENKASVEQKEADTPNPSP